MMNQHIVYHELIAYGQKIKIGLKDLIPKYYYFQDDLFISFSTSFL